MLTGLKGEILFLGLVLPQGQSDQKHPWTKDSWPQSQQSQDGHMIPSEILVVFLAPQLFSILPGYEPGVETARRWPWLECR